MNISKLYLLLLPALLFFTSTSAQQGKDGASTVTAANVIVNEYTTLTADASAGATTLTVANSGLNTNSRFSGTLAAGDLLLIIQMQGASVSTTAMPDDSTWGVITSYNNCGWHEFAEVLSAPNLTSVEIACGLQHNYTASGKVQVIRVPRYLSLTITGTITAPAWDGTTGGVMTAEIQGNTLINAAGKIDLTGKGFRGGTPGANSGNYGGLRYRDLSSGEGSEKGEGIAGYQADYDAAGGRYCMGAAANGGGGGNIHNAGGGGGANAGIVAAWTGRGNPDTSTASWKTAWNLEYNGFATSSSSGGGRGGYSFSGKSVSPLSNAPSSSDGSYTNTAWGGDFRRNTGGRGGQPLDYSTGRIFLGGGGGAGQQNNTLAGPGTAGGGLLFLVSYGSVSGTGQIVSDGAGSTVNDSKVSGGNTDAAGGGGGGGTVIINAVGTISGISVSAKGGKGGDQKCPTFAPANVNAYGPGGGGSGGYIAISNGTITQTVSGGANGTTNSAALTQFPPNGATKGGDGIANGSISIFYLTAINDTICPGGSATLTASVAGTAPPSYTYEWYSTATGGTPLASTTTGTFTIPSLNADTTFYVGTCPGTYRIPVQVIMDIPSADSGPDTVSICPGSGITLNGSPSGMTSYTWTPTTNLLNPNSQNPVASPTSDTRYYLTVVNNRGCQATDSITVVMGSSITVDAGSNVTVCPGVQAVLTATPSSGMQSYAWTPSTDLSSTTVYNPTATLLSGSRTYYVTVTDNFGCSGSDSVTVTAATPPVAIAGADSTICQGDSLTLNGSGGGTYLWTPSTGLSNDTIANPVAKPSASAIYALVVTDLNGCTDTDSVSINISIPTADAGSNVTIIEGNSITLNASAGSSFSWSPADSLSCTSCQSPVAGPDTTTQYFVTITNSAGCTATDSVTVIVTPPDTAPPISPTAEVYVPSAFSPNGDLENDVLYVRGNNFKTLQLVVYNRWGEKIFETNNANTGWDGTYKGQKLNSAVFEYYLTSELTTGESIAKKGTITLVR